MSKWEKMSHEEKVTTGTQALISAFTASRDGGGTPTFHFESQIMKLVDRSDKPYSKFLSNNSWWLNSLITKYANEYNIHFENGKPLKSDTPPPTVPPTLPPLWEPEPGFTLPTDQPEQEKPAATTTEFKPKKGPSNETLIKGAFIFLGVVVLVYFLVRKKAKVSK